MSWRALGERGDLAFIREILPDTGYDPFPRLMRQDLSRRQSPEDQEDEDDTEEEDEPLALMARDSLPRLSRPRGGTGSKRHSRSTARRHKRSTPRRPEPPRDVLSPRMMLERVALAPVTVDMHSGWAALVESGALQRALQRSLRASVRRSRPVCWKTLRVRHERLPLGLPLTPCDVVLSSHLTRMPAEA